jgi:syntaxin 16
MSKLKKSEAFTREREREIEQVSFIYFPDGSVNRIFILLLTAHVLKSVYYCCGLKVVESVNELAQIMKDLSVLVIDQVYETLINCQY